MERITRESLEAMGMSEVQIKAILNTVENENGEERVIDSSPKRQVKTIFSDRDSEVTDSAPINCRDAMSVTSIFDLQTYSKGALVRFPDFAEGQPFVARVRRPSMLVLAKKGDIPNTLLESANELFSNGGSGMDKDNNEMLANIYDICEIICEAALKEPTYQQIKDAGLELSDDQLMAIFNYTQTGVKALENFR